MNDRLAPAEVSITNGVNFSFVCSSKNFSVFPENSS